MMGRQVIGVDPATGLLRSWTFDADGGIGEATWTWDEGRWAIDSAGTLADGSGTTALNFLTKTGPDSFTWKSVKRIVDGQSLPDLGPVTVKRVRERGSRDPFQSRINDHEDIHDSERGGAVSGPGPDSR